MNIEEKIIEEMQYIPEPLLNEVLDFLQFLKQKHPIITTETALLSESSLAKDWLKPEEDEAWQHL